MSRRSLALLVLVLGLAWPAGAEPQPEAGPAATLHRLATGHTVTIPERYAVSRVHVGNADVTEFFVLAGRRPTAWNPRRPTKTVIKVRNQHLLRRLLTLLGNQTAPHLTLTLEDEGWVAMLYRTLPRGVQIATKFEDTLDVPVDLSQCEKVTAIIYQDIDAVLEREVKRAGQTGEPVTLDEVFALLLQGRVQTYLAGLDRLGPRPACFDTFSLLRWLKKESAQGFEFAGYGITEDLREILGRVANALQEMQQWQRYRFAITATGWADDIRFGTEKGELKELPLRAELTGVASLRDPLHVFYAGCSADLLVGDQPVEVPFMATVQGEVGDVVDDNCELGAARAYVAVAFLRQRLGRNGVTYGYASGGISPAAPKGKKDPASWKAEIRFRVLAANRAEATPRPTENP